MRKQVLAIALCLCMVLCLLPTAAFAAVDDVFYVDSTDATPVSVTYKVLTEDAAAMTGTVQVGDGTNTAVSTSTTSLALPDTVVNKGITYTVTAIGGQAFDSCASLALTSLPSGVKSIGAWAFNSCASLALSSLPLGVTSIGARAFNNCANLALSSLPSGVASIGDTAFYGCTSLALTELPAGLIILGNYAFQNCTSLALTELPTGLKSIGYDTFIGCTALTSVSMPIVESLGSNAFSGCTGLVSVSMPKLTAIDVDTFSGCTSLTSASMPNAATIGAYAFSGCTSLTSVSMPNAMKIGDSAFSGCTGLVSVSMPKVTEIEMYAFNSCTSLTSISMPKASVIHDFGFGDCTSLASITCGSTAAPPIGGATFEGVAATGTLYVPFGATGYTTANYWPWQATERANVSGTVYDTDGTTPVPGATVTVNGISVTTNSSGEYFLPAALANGKHTISASKGTDSGSLDVTVAGANLENQDIIFNTAPTITDPSESETLTVVAGEIGIMSAAATGTAPLTYQWQQSTDGGQTWSDVGTNSASYTTSAVTMDNNGLQYRCTVSNVAGSVTSPVFTLRVTKRSDIPTTGDRNMPVMWAGITLLFAAGLAGSIALSHGKRRGKGMI